MCVCVVDSFAECDVSSVAKAIFSCPAILCEECLNYVQSYARTYGVKEIKPIFDTLQSPIAMHPLALTYGNCFFLRFIILHTYVSLSLSLSLSLPPGSWRHQEVQFFQHWKDQASLQEPSSSSWGRYEHMYSHVTSPLRCDWAIAVIVVN